jgi:hypothetical protein
MAASEPKKFVGLPLSVAQPLDVGRLIREVNSIDEGLRQAAIRKSNDGLQQPKLSDQLKELTNLNKIDLLDVSDRTLLIKFLEAIRDRAPKLHISFGSEPAGDFIDKIMTWLRREIHPLVLLTVGLEPNIGAGCTVRTTNKYFNFSLREKLKQNHSLLVEKINEVVVAEK